MIWDQVLPWRAGYLLACFAHRARYFSLLRQRKVSKRKAIPEACPLRGFPALLVKPGARATRSRSNRRERPPAFTAMLGCARRGEAKTNTQKPPPDPVCTHRVPQPVRDQARTLSERIEHREIASCARPRTGEERRESAQPMSALECPSLWVLSLGQARESTSPFRAKQEVDTPHRTGKI